MPKRTEDYNLQVVNPFLAQEWHLSKNKPLRPTDVTPNSNKKVWWKCSKGHEWKARVNSRNKGSGCPYCAGQRAHKEHNLQKATPEVAKEWHPTKNGTLTPKDVTPYSERKVWWRCSKGHEWQANIHNRNRGRGCPYCAGRFACDDNCLQTINPTLAKEWHPTKNGSLTPRDVTLSSNKKAWWKCNRGHEWKATIGSRSSGIGCPYCSGTAACEDNCLQTINPTLAKQWHPTKNGSLTPRDVTPGSEKKVWWKCNRGHEWKARIGSRSSGIGCPYCHSATSVRELRIYTEIKYLFSNVRHRAKLCNKEVDIYIPNLKFAIEVDSTYWHRDRYSTDKHKTEILQNEGIFLLHLREHGLKKILEDDIIFSKKDEDFELVVKTINVIFEKVNIYDIYLKKRITTYVRNGVIANEREFIKFLEMLPSPLPGDSLFDIDPTLAKQWHPTKNGSLTPRDVATGSNKKVWWKCSKGHEWKARVNSRNKGSGCPYCRGRFAWDDNCLQTINPTLAKEWHPTKNGSLTPRDVTPGSNKKVWWRCSKGHEWQAKIAHRNKGSGCPHRSRRRK